MTPLFVLRPEPGASETAARAAAAGLSPVVAPLFTVFPLAWDPPDPARFDAVMITSANAARHGGDALERYRHLPLYAVGAASAAAASAAGFGRVFPGLGDAGALMDRIAGGPHRRILHLCGQHRRTPLRLALSVDEVPVYASRVVDALPPAILDAAVSEAVALLHSTRAAKMLQRLGDEAGLPRANLSLVAIAPDVAAAAGTGWRGIETAPKPTDSAMLAIARILCENPSG